MNKATIIEALGKLDVKNDEHWTDDGAPRLNVLAAEFPGITRQLVVVTAPLFNRKNPALPDLEALRAEAEKAALDADAAAVVAAEAAVQAKRKAAIVQNLEAPINDRHRLARENRGWYQAQIEEDSLRATRQDALDKLLSAAGGVQNIGQHPVERDIAAKVIKERHNVVINTKKKPAQEAKQ